jgi:pSer/pThr/pTyr-binding forkhead associated (FHA) protein
MTESEIAGYFSYWLIDEKPEERRLPFFMGENRIGRNADNRIIIPNRSTSNFHGNLTVTATGMTYIDLGGKNGTKINNESEDNLLSPKTEVEVYDGTTLYLGDIKCKIQRLPYKETME